MKRECCITFFLFLSAVSELGCGVPPSPSPPLKDVLFFALTRRRALVLPICVCAQCKHASLAEAFVAEPTKQRGMLEHMLVVLRKQV